MPAGVFRPYTLTDVLGSIADQSGGQGADTTVSGVGFFAEADELTGINLAVTATASGTNVFDGIALTVKVVTGAEPAAAQPAAADGSSSAANPPQIAITPDATGSWVYGAVSNLNLNTPYTPNAATTFSLNAGDVTDQCQFGAFRSTSATTASTPVTVGASAPANSCFIAAAEILALATLAEDPSSPPGVSASAETISSASFMPPPGSLLVAMVAADLVSPSGAALTIAVTDSYGLTWTRVAGDPKAVATVWVAQVPAITDTVTATVQLPNGWDGGEWCQFAWEVLVNNLGLFGNGSDGAVTLDGSTTYNGFSSLAGSTYTLTRDVLATVLTINPGVTLKVAGYRIFVQGTLTNNGTITANGNNGAASGTAGATTGNGSLGGGKAGGAGSTGNGSAGSNATVGSHAGGAGGAGGTGTAGAGGTTSSSASWWFQTVTALLTGVLGVNGNTTAIVGGAGGGGGGGDGTNPGGGGASGGGVVAIFAWAVVNNSGTITANGANGGTPTTGNAGGGGSGAGGLILVYTLSAWTAGTTSVAAGTPGSGVGTGAAGNSGGVGTVLNVVLA